jgi:hypothetical protein
MQAGWEGRVEEGSTNIDFDRLGSEGDALYAITSLAAMGGQRLTCSFWSFDHHIARVSGTHKPKA